MKFIEERISNKKKHIGIKEGLSDTEEEVANILSNSEE